MQKTNKMNKLTILLFLGVLFCMIHTTHADCTSNNISENGTLQALFVIFRHGSRTPRGTYPNDPYNDLQWPEGYGALIPKGISEAFNLGENLRKRYCEFLSSYNLYSSKMMKVMSSNRERTMMTASSVLAGFLPPSNNENPIDKIRWQPVAVHSIPDLEDKYLRFNKPCPKYTKLLQKLLDNLPKDYQEMINNITLPDKQNFYEYLSNNSGLVIKDFRVFLDFYDKISVQSQLNLPLPKWLKLISTEKIQAIFKRSYEMLTENFQMKKIRGGPLLTTIIKKMIAILENRLNPNRKIFMFSGHDVTILALARALNIQDQIIEYIPEYASALVFELHKTMNGSEVRIIYYKNGKTEIPIQVKIPYCYEPCTLEKFKEIMSPLLIENYEEYCKIDDDDNDYYNVQKNLNTKISPELI